MNTKEFLHNYHAYVLYL